LQDPTLFPPSHAGSPSLYPVRNKAPLLLAPLDAKLSNEVNRGWVL